MKWKKKGLIVKACGQREWMYSHIQNPFAVEFSSYVRVYFTTRPKPQNGQYRSVIAYMDLDKTDLSNVVRICEKPVLRHGGEGTFDEHGVMPGAIVNQGGEYWMYYLGWKKTVSVPYAWAIGLAISKDNGETFERIGNGPIVNVSYDDPYLLAAPRSVFQESGIWHMFYPSGTGWITDNHGRKESVYLNRHAVSLDGISWKKDSGYCMGKVYEDESQGGGCIIMENNIYHMFFSYRHSIDFRNDTRGYTIGYAKSKDLMTWERNDEKAGIELSEDGWDSEMICYPHVIKIGEKWIMFYCGNAFGQGGIGYASLKEMDIC